MEINSEFIGIVTSRSCPTCGHHEIGFTTQDGVFHPLKPGTLIQVLQSEEMRTPLREDKRGQGELAQKEEEDPEQHVLWMPNPIKGDRELRLKYAVFIEPEAVGKVSGDVYRAAYLEKLKRLIEREVEIPLSVILDRFFTAPHLASGNSREIVSNMWEELDEIRRPVLLVSEWIERQDDEMLERMVHPKSREELSDQPPGEEQLRKELEGLMLEEFLELL